MAVTIPRGPRPDADPELKSVVDALERYAADHPGTEAAVYRHGRFLLRLRVVDPAFAGLNHSRRLDSLRAHFDALPEEVLNDLHQIVLLTPDEVQTSRANREFDDPIPARF